jgi:hypothetical protein
LKIKKCHYSKKNELYKENQALLQALKQNKKKQKDQEKL